MKTNVTLTVVFVPMRSNAEPPQNGGDDEEDDEGTTCEDGDDERKLFCWHPPGPRRAPCSIRRSIILES